MENYAKHLNPFFGVYMTRGEDSEANKGLIPTIEAFDNLIVKADGKFLFGTDEPTLLDIWFAPFLETLVDWRSPSVMSNVLDDVDFATRGVNLVKYVEKWRAHPLIHPWYMNTIAATKHWERTRGWTKGVKCQITVEYLADAFAETYGK